MAQYLKWILADGEDNKGAAGCYVPNAVTLAQAETFIGAVVALSDGLEARASLSEEAPHSYNLGDAGVNPIRYRGSVTIQRVSNPQERYIIGVPGIADENVDNADSRNIQVTDAAAAGLLAAFATMTGISAADLKVVRTDVHTYRRRA